jgi:hypothetical protein
VEIDDKPVIHARNNQIFATVHMSSRRGERLVLDEVYLPSTRRAIGPISDNLNCHLNEIKSKERILKKACSFEQTKRNTKAAVFWDFAPYSLS